MVQKKQVKASKPNSAEPSQPSVGTVNEDAQKDERMMAGVEAREAEFVAVEPKPGALCNLCGKPSADGYEHKECMDREAALADLAGEPKPFNPQEAIAKLLKKNGA